MRTGDTIELDWVRPLHTLVVKVEKIDDKGIRGAYRTKDAPRVYRSFTFNWANILSVAPTTLKVQAEREFNINGVVAKVGDVNTKLGTLIFENIELLRLAEFIKKGT